MCTMAVAWTRGSDICIMAVERLPDQGLRPLNIKPMFLIAETTSTLSSQELGRSMYSHVKGSFRSVSQNAVGMSIYFHRCCSI